MTLFRATVVDTPDDPFDGGALRAAEDAGLLVHDGAVVARGGFGDLRRRNPDEDVVDLRPGLLLPGFVDTHVHFPQARIIGGLGLPLLEWLERCALPEEARMADPGYAAAVARDFLRGLVNAGTTTALVFGAHYDEAVDVLFTEAARVGLRITAGLVLSDRLLRPELLTDPDRAYEQSVTLAKRWHGDGRLRYAVTPRFSLSCSEDLMDACAAVLRDVPGTLFTSHVNENAREIATVAQLFGLSHYVDTYHRHGLVGPSSVLAHNVHPTDPELRLLAQLGAGVAHCPTSNAALGSGLFPLARHALHGVPVALGSDVGAGTGYSLLKEGIQAYFVQQLLGEQGLPLTAPHLLHLATSAGAHVLGLADEVGDLSAGKRFDAQWICPADRSPLAVALEHAADADQAVARVFAMGSTADVAGVWVDGVRLR